MNLNGVVPRGAVRDVIGESRRCALATMKVLESRTLSGQGLQFETATIVGLCDSHPATAHDRRLFTSLILATMTSN